MKKITILNGITEDNYLDFEKDLGKMCESSKGFEYQCFTLRNMNLHYCTGCWNCWLKTPGECAQKDDMPKILRSIIHSDLTVFVSPVIMGFVSAELKKVNDKMIPLVHPYIDIFEKECHHVKRYEKYPKFGLVLLEENKNVPPTMGIIIDLFKRMALNMKTTLAFTSVTQGDVEVLKNEFDRI